jgi:septum formation protein
MLKKILNNYRLILASNSPRRQQLLKGLDLEFEVITFPDVDESFPEHLMGSEIATYLSEQKAKAYSKLLDKNTIVITADTIVWLDNKVLNKPADKTQAIQMLKTLSGQMHTVFTGVSITSIDDQFTFFAETKVWFRRLNDKDIEYYVENYKPFDKAGAYGAQEWIGYVAIEKIEGSYFNVMGLPVQKLYSELERFLLN